MLLDHRRLWCGLGRLGVGLLVLGGAARAQGATLTVGPGKSYARPCAAIAAAKAGDVIEVEASGVYAGDTCAWATDNLTVRGVNGRAKIDITGVTPVQQKGLFTIAAANATLENLELSGAAIAAAAGNNGAGVRHQGLNLTVRGCFFHDNQNGILGSPATAGQGEVLIEGSEFARNGAGDGYSHNMYLGNYAKFTLRGSYSHQGRVGHLVKSRAFLNLILYNRLTDEAGGSASYELNLPNGGTSLVIGNVIAQSETTQNPSLIAYGEEGLPAGYSGQLFVVNNTFLNLKKTGTFVSSAAGTTVVLRNNLFWNGGTLSSQATAQLAGNFDSSTMGDPQLVSAASYDVRLKPGSPCIDKGVAPGVGGGQPLEATQEYGGLATTPRSVSGAAIDVGAYEHRPAAPDGGGLSDGGGLADPDGGAQSGGVEGGCSQTGRRGGPGLLGALGALLALALMRRRIAR